MFLGAPENMSSTNNNKINNMDICNKIDSLFEDKLIQDAMKESEIIFGKNWEKLPSQCSKEEFYKQLPQAPAHAYAVYTFGNQKVQKIRNIKNASDDIKNRTGKLVAIDGNYASKSDLFEIAKMLGYDTQKKHNNPENETIIGKLIS